MTDMFNEGYIGVSATTAEKRFVRHKSHSKRSTTHISCAIKKYGDEIIVETLVEGSSDYCYELENKLRPVANCGWNTAIGGQQPSNLGGKDRQETLEKKRKAHLGRVFSDESRRLMSERRKGMKFSESHLESMSKCRIGRKLSEETKQRMREAHVNSPAPTLPPWLHSKANKDVWVLSKLVHEYLTLNPTTCTYATERYFGLAKQKLAKMFVKLKAGWNPNEDQNYLAWLAEYNSKDKLSEATPTN